MNAGGTLVDVPVDRRREPWLGLASYTETEAELFYGREAETDELLRMLRRETLTVVFGPSGTGKTSLLQAGLSPKLRADHFLPVIVRIDYSGNQATLVSQVRAAMAEALRDYAIEDTSCPADHAARETLWEYFHRAVLWDRRNNPITPVVLFDQFEEIFTLGHNHAGTNELVRELSELIENYIPETVRARVERTGEKLGFDAGEQHYRVLISLREDFVSRLDSLRRTMPSVMHNRFALTRMDGQQALGPVLKPARGIVSDAVAEQIVRKVASAGARIPLKQVSIDPALLSLMCRELNTRRLVEKQETIQVDLVNNAAADILKDFYERSFQGLQPQARAFVEDRLLTSDGFRTTVAMDAAAHEGLRGDMEVLVDRRVLRAEERLGLPHLELTHDVLTQVARASRGERQARQERERGLRDLSWTRRSLVVSGSVALLWLIFAVVAQLTTNVVWILNQRAQDAQFFLRGRHPVKDIVLVVIDQKSLDTFPELRAFGHPYYAEAIHAAAAGQAKVLAFDVAFDTSVENWFPNHDQILAEAVASARIPTIIAYRPELLLKHAERPVPVNMLAAALGLAAYSNLMVDRDGFVRNQKLIVDGRDMQLERAFALRVAEKFVGSDATLDRGTLTLNGRSVPISRDRAITINFAGPAGTFPRVSLGDFLGAYREGNIAKLKSSVEGKAVLLGPDYNEDRWRTPFYTRIGNSEFTTAGVEIHANTLATLLNGDYLLPAPMWARYAALIAVAALTILGASLAIRKAALVQAAIVTAIGAGTQMAFRSGSIFPLLELLLCWQLCLTATMVFLLSVAVAPGDLFRRAFRGLSERRGL